MASIGAGTGHTVRVLSLVGATHFMMVALVTFFGVRRAAPGGAENGGSG
jgi:hypothetical protein